MRPRRAYLALGNDVRRWPPISLAYAVREAVRRGGFLRYVRNIPRVFRSSRKLGCGLFESLYVALMPGEFVRARARRAWRDWDQEEIDREMRAWKKFGGRDSG